MVVIAGVITGCLILYFAISVVRHQRKFVRLQRSYFLNEVSLLETERARIARDLHDELGPILSLTKLLISATVVTDKKGTDHLNKANQNLEDVIHKLGEISINLSPATLLKKGLYFALGDFFEDMKEAFPQQIIFRYDVANTIPHSTSIHIYRLLRELVHNCLKHAAASRITIAVKDRKEKLYIHYEDDGKGFAISDAMENPTGDGLRSIKSRTEMLGGKLYYQSKLGAGTHYSIEIPL